MPSRPAQDRLQAPLAHGVDAVVVGEVEVKRRDRRSGHARPGRRGRCPARPRTRVEAVDPVALAAVSVGVDQAQLVVVEALAEAGHLDPLDVAAGQLTLISVPSGRGCSARPATIAATKAARDREVELAAEVPAHLPLQRLLGDGDRREPEHDALEGRGDGARVGDVVAEVGAVVDAGDDQLRLRPDQAELGEADAVDRRAVGREADGAVVEATSSTHSGERVVIERAVALRLESGAMTCDARPRRSWTARPQRLDARRPIPSSLVISTLASRSILWRAVALE